MLDATGLAYTPVAFDLGGSGYLRDGEVLPDADLARIRTLDAVLLGAVGTPDVPPGHHRAGLLLQLRFDLDLYVNLRPFVAPPSALNDGVDCSSCGRTPRVPTSARAASCARARRTRSRPRAR